MLYVGAKCLCCIWLPPEKTTVVQMIINVRPQNIMLSRKTILTLVNALDFQTHDEVGRFCIEFDLEHVISNTTYIKQKETAISKHLIANKEAKGPMGSSLVLEVIEYLLKTKPHSGERYYEFSHHLEKDGYLLTENSVRASLPTQIPLIEIEDRLLEILKKRGFDVALGHYEQAVAAHGRGEWAAANAQLRSLVEEFFDKIHSLINAGTAQQSHARKTELANVGFFRKEYNEFLNNGMGFVEGFWKRLQPQGSHPGLSESVDSTFRLHLVLLVLHYFAERLDDELA